MYWFIRWPFAFGWCLKTLRKFAIIYDRNLCIVVNHMELWKSTSIVTSNGPFGLGHPLTGQDVQRTQSLAISSHRMTAFRCSVLFLKDATNIWFSLSMLRIMTYKANGDFKRFCHLILKSVLSRLPDCYDVTRFLSMCHTFFKGFRAEGSLRKTSWRTD